jgi:hypothetical protein
VRAVMLREPLHLDHRSHRWAPWQWQAGNGRITPHPLDQGRRASRADLRSRSHPGTRPPQGGASSEVAAGCGMTTAILGSVDNTGGRPMVQVRPTSPQGASITVEVRRLRAPRTRRRRRSPTRCSSV